MRRDNRIDGHFRDVMETYSCRNFLEPMRLTEVKSGLILSQLAMSDFVYSPREALPSSGEWMWNWDGKEVGAIRRGWRGNWGGYIK